PPGGGQQIGTAGTISGRVFTPEGRPLGGPFVEVTVRDAAGTILSPTINPSATGSDAGRFSIPGLPLGQPLTVSIDYESEARGDFLGADRVVTLTAAGGVDLGAIELTNEYLDLGWAAYRAKQFNLALSRFETSRRARRVQADDTDKSSSYLVGIGWTKVKRGRDTLTMCSQTAEQGFEWDEALRQFQQAADTDAFDADARVGAAAALLALSAKSAVLDPVQFNLTQFFYGLQNPYFDEAERQLNEALLISPDFKSDHDEIVASDLEVTRLFTQFMQGKEVTMEQIDALSERDDLNQGSLETLQALSDLIQYKRSPLVGGQTS
ncbi:MAG TPA: carboxypeptidase-like regulatory domain-containing protein, partial [bacterium]|nr:carboxypeptidase-like regulatory domain-containing protein [bacterium]